ncbi:MAG TPA: DUF2911 domain-containing protein [Vicinamibacterales bacterium]|nr:DUF2911 domain-containing protein [Vicinamibacterales bacterium]
MRRFVLTLAAAALVASGPALQAQKTTQVHPGKGGSPHVKSEWTIDGANISIEYGRPSLKGRAEAEMMPPGKPWRTGADEATVLTTDKALKFGSLSLQPGSYTLNTQPGAEWQLIVGKLGKPGQWGVPYQSSLEIGRAPMKAGKTTAPVDQLTISIDDTPAGGTLRVEWGNTSASIPFTVG